MGLDDIPIRSQAARRLAARDAAALKSTEPPAFRLDRARLRLEGALRNGLGEREALRLRELAEPRRPLAQWQRAAKRAWTSAKVGLAAGAFAMAAAAAAVVWTSTDTPSVQSTQKLLASGETHRYQLEDGSSIELSPEARGELSMNGETVRFSLERGLVEFDVVPHQGRHWQIAAEDYEVVVVGTHFTVDYQPQDRFAVYVERGAVDVHIPEQEAPLRLAAGARLEATRGEVTLHHNWRAEQNTDESEQSAESAQATTDQTEPGSGARVRRGVTELRGARESATLSAPRPTKPGSVSSSAREQPGDAKELSLLRRARTAIANGDHKTALNWIGMHQRRFPKGQLVEEREALRVEALRGLGRNQEARKAAGEFRERFPKSVLSPQMPADDR